ncbi:MAG: hypothetical protein KME28_27470 [Pelatocladus maniniholoensis HA4357-MV3]|jgi:hypothetical protein|uniref:Uncharacterized protein n=1 Tax=Pelatocladus maniniholoensis HA4357-MV3 TaxID=1117104 RepID=A0A9E3HDQ0_9NOST|nr:hypothetical protein [Pelatocladus maniniholoensis HA4357-MV3]
MANTINISTAAEQLGISEEQIRFLLEPFYKNYETIKRISTKNFKVLSEQLMEAALAQPENESVDVDAIEAQTTEQPTFLQNRETNDYTTDLDSSSTDGGSDDSDISQDEEESALANIPSEEIELKVRHVLDTNINLSNQVFDLARITQTLAVLAADEAVESFKNIYTVRLNGGIDDFLTEFSQSAINSIEQLRGEKTEDFFATVQTNYSRSNVKENMQKLSEYIV